MNKQNRPPIILSRLLLDVSTLLSFTYCLLTSPSTNNSIILLITSSIFYTTSGLTNRWTIGIPVSFYQFLQILRRIPFCSWLSTTITILSGLCIIFAAALSILFPAVELPSIHNGKYKIGVTDLFLPIDTSTKKMESLNIRLVYPTDKQSNSTTPYLNPELSHIICSEIMKNASPIPTLKKLGWMLHTWCLARLHAIRNAPPLVNEKMPIVIFSHGLFGCAELYSYQAMKLASNGCMVVMMNHTDGSAPAVKKEDGSLVLYDSSISKLFSNEKYTEYIRCRRSNTNHRTSELLSATTSLLNLNQNNIPTLQSRNISFVNKLDTQTIIFMGHSYGGATALCAAARNPDLVSAVIAHDPALDWMTDDGRCALLKDDDSGDGGTKSYEDTSLQEEKKIQSLSDTTGKKELHDVELFFLFSEEWEKQNWGKPDLFQSMHQNNQFGPPNGLSDIGIISKAHHQEFSDVCTMTPLWLGQMTGMTGKRYPLDTLEESAERSLKFIEMVKEKNSK